MEDNAVMEQEITPTAVVKSASTGTKELKTIGLSIDSIGKTLQLFADTVMRTDEKANQISAALESLAAAIRENPENILDEETKGILRDLDVRVFDERFFTEKCGRGSMRMTDDTKFNRMERLAMAAAKISDTKFKMSGGDYTPTATVLEKLKKQVSILRSCLSEHIGPVAGQAAINKIIKEISELWNE